MVAGLAAKDIPQTGSITVSTALCRGNSPVLRAERSATSCARIDRAISAAVLAPRSRPAGLCRRARCASSTPSEARTDAPRVALATSAT
jgi:hypothetical protein